MTFASASRAACRAASGVGVQNAFRIGSTAAIRDRTASTISTGDSFRWRTEDASSTALAKQMSSIGFRVRPARGPVTTLVERTASTLAREMPNYADRVERAREAMRRHGIDLLYLAPGANAQYLSGWRRSRPHFGNVNYPGGWIQGLFLGLKQGPILAVPRMVAEFDLEPATALDIRVLPDRGDPANFLNDLLKEFEPRIGAIAVENRAWSEQILALRQVRPDVELRLASDVMAALRMVKEPDELDVLQQAANIVDTTMADIVNFLDPDSGQTELDVASEIDRLMI